MQIRPIQVCDFTCA
uniref:Uncharacterized protein n=1 Tax=Anguilla anguilla TaxID=7936 RepID=A0A0E9RJI3_ANGAN